VGTAPETALESVVFAAIAADVRHVVIDGKTVVADGRHATLDVAHELDEAVRSVTA
jgi:cytosine/adenosine deaminase-related metal-dependent hydrolase